MIAALDTTLLGEVSGFIAERLGLHFPEERWSDLARGLEAAGRELGFEYPDACKRWLTARDLTTRQIETLASHLTVGETYFLRDPASFEVLAREILPPLVARRVESGRTLRLWSAGCSTGEEAYSLAITCARTLPDLEAWNASVLATDINPKALAKAEAGVYSQWSFRGAPGWLRERFLAPTPEGKLEIAPTLKNLVHFGYLNLAEDVYPSLHNHTNAMDVIFCRNVLMYFTPDHQRRVVTALHRCLMDGGYLVVSPAEAGNSLFPMFAMEDIGGVILYRKTSRPTCVVPWPSIVSPEPSALAPEPAFFATSTPLGLPREPAFVAAAAPAATVAPVESATPIIAPPGDSPLELARTYANQGKLAAALVACRDAVAADRTNPAAHFLCATICEELGRPEEAVAALGKVLYLDQDFVLAHHGLGGLYKRLGKHEKSKRHLAIALELLAHRSRDEIVPESDGMTCGRLQESVRAMTGA
ncbi:MAG: tetratricopeptide repeat protein [Deltaproteobacteria bacterium]|nr:tetratricopeptide repeat protein [Deltaproteobacteria bacterium]